MAQGNFGDTEEHKKAGKMGGDKTAAAHDKEFYEDIARKSNDGSSNPDNPGEFGSDLRDASKEGQKGGEASH